MKEAQRFPADFDGIIAGRAGARLDRPRGAGGRVAQALQGAKRRGCPQRRRSCCTPRSSQACDAHRRRQGRRHRESAALQVRSGVLAVQGRGQAAACLTPAQVETARLIYSPTSNPKTKREISGLCAGQRAGMDRPGLVGVGARDRARSVPVPRLQGSRRGTIQKFNFDTDVARAEEADGGTINALDPNLKPFFDRGGKLIQYHGWSDPQISPGATASQYYTRVAAARRRRQGSRRLPAVHGARHGALRRRRGPEHLRHDGGARAVGGARQGARSDHRVASTRTARSIARARCARIRRSRPTRAPAAPTRRRTSSAKPPNR